MNITTELLTAKSACADGSGTIASGRLVMGVRVPIPREDGP